IKACHRFRKMYGGGMRQAGILAAAGLYALDHQRARLPEDHSNARALVEALAGAPNLRVMAPQTNIVMIDVERAPAAKVTALAREEGVLLGAAGSHRIRAVTHLDIDREGALTAARVIAAAAAKL